MAEEPLLDITDLEVRYGSTLAVAGIDLEVHEGETVCILGPSGCGKSTVLRAVAGLEVPTRGRIHLDGRDLAPLRPDQRRIGLMFQDHALFPHRTVGENVGFGLRMQGLPADAVAERTREILELVGLAAHGDRPVTELSGGEQQRVALARAVAPRPRLLMLDEPLGSLDRALRDRLLVELPELFAELGTSVLYVTHDQEEALVLADRVVLMRAGEVVQAGTPPRLWRDPVDTFVASFLGYETLLDATVADGVATTSLGPFPAPGHDDGPATVLVLPEGLGLAEPGGGDHPVGDHTVSGEVTRIGFAGDHHDVTVTTDEGPVLPLTVWRGPAPEVGSTVGVTIDPAAIRILR